MGRNTAWVILVLILAGLGAWYFNARQPVSGHPSMAEIAEPVTPAPAEPRFPLTPPAELEPQELVVSEPQPEPEPLPALPESDPFLRLALDALLGEEAVGDWLVTEQFATRVVASIDALSARQVPARIWPVAPPGGKFLVSGEGDRFVANPANAARYRAHVELFLQADVDQVLGFYRRHYPLFQQAYEELGYPGGYFNDRLVGAVDQLLATPEPEGPLALIKPEAVYVYADPEFEALSAGQKLLLRASPDDRAAIRVKLQDYRNRLTSGAEG